METPQRPQRPRNVGVTDSAAVKTVKNNLSFTVCRVRVSVLG